MHQAKYYSLRGQGRRRLPQGCAILESTMSTQGSDVTIETSLGSFSVELYWDHAPKVRETLANVLQLRRPQTCKNFAELAKKGYYNGVIFHRIIPVCTASCFRVY